MSQFFSTRYLRYRRSGRVGRIERDEPCRACDYNLRGLEYGAVCPECGAPIHVPDPARDSISDAPRTELRRLRSGLILAMISLPPMLVAVPISAALAATGQWVGPAIMLGIGAIWIAAVFRITAPMTAPGGVARGFGPGSRLRCATRWLQLCWPASHALLALTTAAPGGSQPLLVLSIIVAVVAAVGGMLGIILLAVMLARLAEWSQNDFAIRLFDWSIWGLLVCTGALLLTPLNVFIALFGCMFAVFWVAAIGCFFYGLAEMMRTLHWAVRHAREQEERVRSMRDKMKTTHATHPGGG